MAKCPLARNIMLSSGGALTYATPLSVAASEPKHDELVETVKDRLLAVLEKEHNLFEIEPFNICLTIREKKEEKYYIVCGRPDLAYFVYSKPRDVPIPPFILVGEVTLSPSVKHMIRGEVFFYLAARYLRYGTPVAGLLVSPRGLYLIVPKPRSLMSWKKLFSKVHEEEAIKEAESLRKKKPWVCSLCDLKHVCPLGAEL